MKHWLFTLAALFIATGLAACGGSSSGGSGDGNDDVAEDDGGSDENGPIEPIGSIASMSDVCAMGADPDSVSPPDNGEITSVRVSAPAGSGGPFTNVPVTFGQAFAPGEVDVADQLSLQTPGAEHILETQVDIKATHGDGSVRHAILTARVPDVDSDGTLLSIMPTGSAAGGSAIEIDDLLAEGHDATLEITEDGTTYAVSLADLLEADAGETWLEGPLVTEWLVRGPLTNAAGEEHPRLHARFNVRAHDGLDPIRIAVILENTWAYQDNPGNVVYDLDLHINGEQVGEVRNQIHYAHSRWRRVFWVPEAPNVHVAHDFAYLAAARAVPNYDLSLTVPEDTLADMAESWNDNANKLMGTGTGIPSGMSAGGANPQIGPYPQWAARFMLTPDPRARCVTLGNAEQAGTWPLHYRKKDTDLPVSIDEHREVTILGRRSGLAEEDQLPECDDCDAPFSPDSAHQPALTYLPYLLTGDYYFLEELHFWANWNMMRANPRSRQYERGLVRWEQPRGQAWSLRTLAQTAYITPGQADGTGADDHPFKAYFLDKLKQNRIWYHENYIDLGTGDPDDLANSETYANELGWIGRTLGRHPGRISPWQDDFFTWAVGHTVNLGFDGWMDMLAFKVDFPVGRIDTPASEGFCWKNASIRVMQVVDDEDDPAGTAYTTFREVYDATREASLETGGERADRFPTKSATGDCNELETMASRPSSAVGLPANMRIALAIAREFELPTKEESERAWDRFINRPNPVTSPSYEEEPQYAISPR